jgi:hypothetical protein
MDWEWIKANKKLVIAIAAIGVGGLALVSGVITWDDFMSLFERVDVPIEGGG